MPDRTRHRPNAEDLTRTCATWTIRRHGNAASNIIRRISLGSSLKRVNDCPLEASPLDFLAGFERGPRFRL